MGSEGQVLDFDSYEQMDSVGSIGREVIAGVWASLLAMSGAKRNLLTVVTA